LACAAAFLIGFSFLLKYTLGVFLGVVLLSEMIRLRASKKVLVKHLMVMGGGFLIPIIVAAIYLYATDALDAFWQIQVHNVLGYTSAKQDTSWWATVTLFFTLTLQLLPLGSPLALLGLLSLYVPMLKNRVDQDYKVKVLILTGWTGGAMASDMVQGKFFGYHAIPLFPTVAILSVAAILFAGRILLHKVRPRFKEAIVLPLCLGLLFTFPPQLALFADTANIILGHTTMKRYWMSGRFEGYKMSTRNNLLLADYILQTTHLNDTVFIWGHEPMVNFLTKRNTGNRYPYNHPMIARWARDVNRREFLKSIQKAPPVVFVVSSGDAMPWSNGVSADSFEMLKRNRTIHDFINERYYLAARIGPFYVMRKNL
jgi:hypothetical protein